VTAPAAGPGAAAPGSVANERTAKLVVAGTALLLVDAAVETFAAGSPVRAFLCLGALLAFAVAAALEHAQPPAWRALRWPERATAATGTLALLLAASVWLEGGVGDGVRLLGTTTATWLLLASAAAVSGAGFSLLRARELPPWVRRGSAGLAAYGTLAFGAACLEGLPFPALFAGRSFWTFLPTILQGAPLAAFGVLPAAVLLQVWRGAHGAAWSRIAKNALVLLLAFDLSLAGALGDAAPGLPLGAQPTPAERSSSGSFRPSTARAWQPAVASLDELDAEAHRDLLDALARSLAGLDADLAFVRDRIAFEPYPGAMRGAEGTLRAQRGNAVDRSLLLAELLRRQGRKVRFARGSVDEARAASLLERAFRDAARAPASTWAQALPPDFLRRVRRRAVRDFAAIRAALGELRTPPADEARRRSLAELADHVWVQAQADDGTWRDLDPSFEDASVGSSYAAVASTSAELPPELYQQATIELRVVTRRGEDERIRTVVSQTRRVADLVGRRVAIFHAEAGALAGGVAGALAGGIAGGRIQPLLLIGDEMSRGQPFQRSASGDGKKRQKGPPSGGLAAIQGMLAGGPAATFVAERLVIAIAPPSGPVRRSERVLLETQPPGGDDRTGDATLAGGIHGIFFNAGVLDPAALLDGIARGDAEAQGTLSAALSTVASLATALGFVSEATMLAGLGDGMVLLRPEVPRIQIVSASLTAEGRLGIAFDLRRDDLRGLAGRGAVPGGVARGKLWFGALEGALEHELASQLGAQLGWEAGPPRSTSALLDAADGLRVLDPEAAGLPPSVAAELGAGDRLVTPVRDDALLPGGWKISGRSGNTVALLAGGLHAAVIWGHLADVAKRANPYGGARFNYVNPQTLLSRPPTSSAPADGGGGGPGYMGGVRRAVGNVLTVATPYMDAFCWGLSAGIAVVIAVVVYHIVRETQRMMSDAGL